MKQYVAIIRDHSQSMRTLVKGAAKDYNANLEAIQKAARETGLDTILNVVKCGVGWDASVVRDVVNSNVYVVEPISEKNYEASGTGTPLFDSVNEAITLMRNVPDADSPDVTFLVMVITDGEENRSKDKNGLHMQQSIAQLQATDRWTFVFRVPKGYGATLRRFGVPAGNIAEWEQTERGMERSTQITTSGISTYMNNVSRGIKSTDKFYADLSNISQTQVKSILNRIYPMVIDNVSSHEDGMAIKTFVEQRNNYNLGEWYYELTKTEKIQDSKKIIVFDRGSNMYYTGNDARSLLGFPSYGEIKVVPGNLGSYKVFVQSTSVNRKLVGGTKLIRYVN